MSEKMNEEMNEEINEVCNQCDNNCSVEQLQCGRGRRYFEIQKSDSSQIEDEGMKEIHAPRGRRGYGRDCGQEHDHEHERHGGRRGKRENRNHEECGYNGEKEDDLTSLLGKCGHYLHHKRGGKRGQGKILKILANHPEISQKEMQEKLEIQAGSMSEIVMKLESKGFLIKTKDEADKRMTMLKITEEGIKMSEEIASEDQKDGQDLFTSLTAKEQEQLKELLKKLTNDWDERFHVSHMGRDRHRDRREYASKDKRRHERYHRFSNL